MVDCGYLSTPSSSSAELLVRHWTWRFCERSTSCRCYGLSVLHHIEKCRISTRERRQNCDAADAAPGCMISLTRERDPPRTNGRFCSPQAHDEHAVPCEYRTVLTLP